MDRHRRADRGRWVGKQTDIGGQIEQTDRQADGMVLHILMGVVFSHAAVKCQLRGVPDDLRQSLQRIADLPSSPTVPAETEGVEKEAESEHPYDIITRVQIDLESYVMLLQVTGVK